MKKTSKKYRLDLLDLGKALLIAALTPVLVIVQSTLDSGSLTFNWKAIGMAAIAGGLSYLLKNFFTPQQIIIKNEANTKNNV